MSLSHRVTQWYIINGERTRHEVPTGVEVLRVTKATCFDEVVDGFQKDYPDVICINADQLSSEKVAQAYKISYILRERTIYRRCY